MLMLRKRLNFVRNSSPAMARLETERGIIRSSKYYLSSVEILPDSYAPESAPPVFAANLN
jgi:hypothetical protein